MIITITVIIIIPIIIIIIIIIIPIIPHHKSYYRFQITFNLCQDFQPNLFPMNYPYHLPT